MNLREHLLSKQVSILKWVLFQRFYNAGASMLDAENSDHLTVWA